MGSVKKEKGYYDNIDENYHTGQELEIERK